jgi:hypothetical protein
MDATIERAAADHLAPVSSQLPAPRIAAFDLVRFAVAAVLLFGAALKVHSLVTGDLPAAGVLRNPSALRLAATFEIALASWLFLGWHVRWLSCATVAFFATGAAYTTLLAIQGQQSCGCLGVLTIHPGLVAVFDLAVVVVVVLSVRPIVRNIRGPICRRILSVSPAMVLPPSALLLAAAWLPADAVAWVRRDALRIEPAIVHIGEGYPGQEYVFSVRIVNRAARPVRIIGGTAECNCSVRLERPLVLEGNSAVTIPVSVIYAGAPGRFQRAFRFYSESPTQPVLESWYLGRVLERQ